MRSEQQYVGICRGRRRCVKHTVRHDTIGAICTQRLGSASYPCLALRQVEKSLPGLKAAPQIPRLIDLCEKMKVLGETQTSHVVAAVLLLVHV